MELKSDLKNGINQKSKIIFSSKWDTAKNLKKK